MRIVCTVHEVYLNYFIVHFKYFSQRNEIINVILNCLTVQYELSSNLHFVMNKIYRSYDL